MRYSDFNDDDGDYDDRMGHFLDQNDRYNDYHQDIVYADNSFAYLEDAIYSMTKQKDDEVHDSIIPYMVGYYPLMAFIPEDSYIEIPEFYEDYPLIVSDSVYASSSDEYESIFKVWTGDGNEIEIVSDDNTHEFQGLDRRRQ
jgi:hypothetical protein